MQSAASTPTSPPPPPLRSLPSNKVSPAVTTATARTAVDKGFPPKTSAADYTLSASDTLLDVIAGEIAAGPALTNTSPPLAAAALPVDSPLPEIFSPARSSVSNSRRGMTLMRSATVSGEGSYGLPRAGSPPSRMHSSGALSPSSLAPLSSPGLASDGAGSSSAAAAAMASGNAARTPSAVAAGSGSAAAARVPNESITSARPGLGGGLDLKVVILGAQGVGKTSLVHRYTSGQFNASSIPSTIGASFLTKKLIIDGVKVRLQLWDTAGQERFRSMAPMYYRGSNAAVIVYDITNPASFDDVRTWVEELRKNVHSDLVIHIVGSKADLASRYRQVSLEDAQLLVSSWTQPQSSPTVTATPLYRSQSQKAAPNSSLSRGAGDIWNSKSTSPSRDTSGNDLPSPTSRLTSGFGSLAAMRRGLISTTSNEEEEGGSGSGKSANSSTRSADEAAIDRDTAQSEGAWDFIEVTEVSAKDNEGIEDVFVGLATRLVERKEQMEALATRRRQKLAGQHGADRDSIFLGQGADGDYRAGTSKPAAGSWCCGA